MSDREKIEAILNLLVDSNVQKLANQGQLVNDDERFGALVFATSAFGKAYKIARSN